MAIYVEDLQLSIDRNKASLAALRAIYARTGADYIGSSIAHVEGVISDMQAPENRTSHIWVRGAARLKLKGVLRAHLEAGSRRIDGAVRKTLKGRGAANGL